MKVKWHKITKTKLPPINKHLLLFNRGIVEYCFISNNTTYRGYADNNWTHWTNINLPK